MSYYILQPLRWLERPAFGLRLKREHPLAHGLEAFFDLRPGLWRINQVSGQVAGTKVNTFGADFQSKWVRTFNPGESGGNYLELETGFNISGKPWTVITGSLHISGGVDWSLLARDTDQWSGVYQGGSATFNVSHNNDFSGAVAPTIRTKSPRGVVHAAVALVSTNNLRATAGGAIAVDTVVSTPFSVGGVLTTCALGLSKRQTAADNQGECYHEYWGLYNRALTDGEMQAICHAPWQMFEPDTPHIYVTVSAGALTGTLAVTEAADVMAASGTTTILGTIARTEASDTMTASGTTTVLGTMARTEAADTMTASGVAGGISGTVAVTEAADTMTASGTTTVLGSIAVTEQNDTSAAAGTTVVLGTLARTEANDTMTASGSVGSSIAGSIGVTEANDLMSAAGTTTVLGTVAVAEANDAMTAAGTTTVLGTMARLEAPDTMTASGVSGAVFGTIAVTEQNDTMGAIGVVGEFVLPSGKIFRAASRRKTFRASE